MLQSDRAHVLPPAVRPASAIGRCNDDWRAGADDCSWHQIAPEIMRRRVLLMSPEAPFENSPVDRVARPQGRALGTGGESLIPSRSAGNGGSGAVVKLGEVVMLLDLHRQGLTVSRSLGSWGSIARPCADIYRPWSGATGLWAA